MKLPCACEGSAPYASGDLGAHDGVAAWTLHTAHMGDHDTQLLVAVHELLHHELIISTPWGLLTSVLGTLADGEHRSARYGDMFFRAAEWSRVVHETYATYFSIGAEFPDPANDRLGDEYRAYYRHADEFCPDRNVPWPARASFAHAGLVAAMAPAALADLLATPLTDWRPEHLMELGADRPDLRWEQTWRHRDRLWAGSSLGSIDSEAAASERIVDSYLEHAGALEALGITCMSRAAYRAFAERLIQQLVRPGSTAPYEIVEQAAETVTSRLEKHQHERLQFRNRPLRIAAMGDRLASRWADFAARHPGLGLHSVLYWLRADLLDRQFEGAAHTCSHVLAMFSVTDRVSATGEVAAWTMNGTLGVDPVAAVFAAHNQRLIVVTTLASIADAPAAATSRHAPRLYALIDLPIVPVLRSWLDSGVDVTWCSAWIDGSHPLYAFAFTVSAHPGVVLVHVTSSAGRRLVLAWLFDVAGGSFVRDPDLGTAVHDEVSSLVQHVTASWWFIDQRAGHRP